jgi:hypothetical protein
MRGNNVADSRATGIERMLVANAIRSFAVSML